MHRGQVVAGGLTDLSCSQDMLIEDSVQIGVQVNGKLRDTVSLPVDADEDVARAAALASAGVIRYLEGREPRKVIVVRNRIINVVV